MSIFTDLAKKTTKRRKESNERFFKKTYSKNDEFVGISMPKIRETAKENLDISPLRLKQLIKSKYHEYRMCGFLILTYRFKKEKNGDAKRKMYEYYMKNIKNVNNWDIVDVTTPSIVGMHIRGNKQERKNIEKFSASQNMWERRVSILACFPLIKEKDFSMFFRIAKKLLGDKEDLIHKALGWMLREVYKKDSTAALTFIKKHYNSMPRTTLRYAIEKMEKSKRKSMLRKGKV